ncbi:ventral anterior homeobox 2-like [Porites lutea]|uniref:ventral anterior homeobox 2-like n=1 Tax=Porites lutea TaxID=51062 RepID=UPI003CC6AC0D
MLQIARYPLPFNPTPVLCPLCTLPPGNTRFTFQPCCFYPTETHPESQVHLPVNSLMSLRRSSFEPYRAPVRSVNGIPLASQNFHSPSNEDITRVQPVRSSGVGANQHGGNRDDSGNLHCTALSGIKKKRQKRTIFTCEQLSRLESLFEEQQYIVGTERQQLAEALNLSETQIKIWFQNRRIKWRKENKQNFPDFLGASPFSVACARIRHSRGLDSWDDE